eukprot:CAMPEP_0197029410 /NCGR_PEP_ID=MMETSP1384-20130603/8856_1 /TAXON_ID=29189 /ORGANISM="Ammonia sp." /LENGTH=618 /DNA_ID=CAMNT_0042458561 /DNA_START=31 /DNA_END=1887 /DNA_ORIENTATION=-
MLSFAVCVQLLALSVLSGTIDIDTNYGPVQGVQVGNMYKFINIPFAKPPVNELRFEPPETMEKWTDISNGQQFGGKIPACPQIGYPLNPIGPTVVTEDCLYLNVFTPAAVTLDSSYAVMLWIYGGSFISGWSTAGALYDPTAIINYIDDIIIVSINYRVGIFGSLYDNTYDTGIEGNQGFLDQKMAIEWVYENIEHFGGDKHRITIFGQSAGAHSVALHLLYNNERIQSAIMESPPIGMALRDTETWYDVPQTFSQLIGCDNETNSTMLECWQSVDLYTILAAQYNPSLAANWTGARMPYTPTVNTDLIPYQPVEAFSMFNLSSNVPPFIVGVNHDEFYSLMNNSKQYSYQQALDELALVFGENNAAVILDRYEIEENATDVDQIGTILSDSMFRCPVRNATENSVNEAWYYHFDVVETAFYKAVFSNDQLCWNRTCHSSELFYIWLPLNLSYVLPFDAEMFNIGHELQTYWTNFAKTLTPNAGNEAWFEYDTNSSMLLEIIDANFSHSIYVDEEICDFWDTIGYAGDYCTDCKLVTTTSTASPTSAPTPGDHISPGTEKNGTLSLGAKIGIGIGAAVIVILLSFIATKCILSRREINKKNEVSMVKSNYKQMVNENY